MVNTDSQPSQDQPRCYRVGDLDVDLVRRTVARDGAILPVKGLSFELLACLLQCHPELATTREIQRSVWGDNLVGQSALTQRVKLLREALAGSARYPDYVEAIKSRGYRLTVPVTPQDVDPAPAGRRRGPLVAAGLAVLMLVAAAWLLWPKSGQSPESSRAVATLFVPPIENAGDDVEWAEGLRQEIIDRLHGMGGVAVTPVRVLPKAAEGNALVLESELVPTADGDALLSTLRNLATGEVLVQQRFPGAGPGQQPRRATQSLADTVTAAVPGGHRARVAETGPAPDPAAYELYLRARYHGAQYASSDLQRGIQLLDRALEIDPDFARGFELRSIIYSLAGTPSYGWMPPAEAYGFARRDALQALALDPELPLANVTLGNILLWHDWNPPAAAMAYQRALEIDGNSLSAWLSVALLHTALGQYEQSIAAVDRALELAPLQAGVHANAGWRLLGARRYEAALAAAQRAEALDPTLRDAYEIQHWAQILLGRPERAFELPQDYISDGGRGYLLAVTGRQREARQELEAMLAARANGYVAPTGIAIILIGLGEFDQALDWLEIDIGQRSREALFLRSSAVYDPLREHPRFRDLLARIGAWNETTPSPLP